MTRSNTSPPQLLFTRERIQSAAENLYTAITTQQLPQELMPHHGIPDGYQWLVLCMTQPQYAHEVLHALYMQLYTHGPLNVTVVTLTSITAYHAAQIVQLRLNPAIFILPRMWDHYPSLEEWEHMGQHNYNRVKHLLYALELRATQFGALATPPELTRAISMAGRILDQYRSKQT